MPADCDELLPLLPAWIDGELDGADGSEMERHVATCASCGARAREQQAFKRALRRSAEPVVAAPASLRAGVLARLDEEAPHGPLAALTAWLSALGPRPVAVGAAAAGVAAWFLLGGLRHPVVPGTAHHVMDDGVALHARALPLDFAASDVGSVQQWLQSRLDFGVKVPRFDQASLEGVRLSTLHTHPAALVRYQVPRDAGRRVSLVIVDDPQERLDGAVRHVGGRDVFLSQARGYNVATWRKDEIVYSLVSDLDEHDILDLVNAAELR